MLTYTISSRRPVTKRTGLLSHAPALSASTMDFEVGASEAAELLKALANRDRLLLLCQLVAGERSVGELGAAAGLEQPSLSQQLGVLRGERLVATRREGKQVIYRIASPAALAVLETLHGLFCAPAQAAPVVNTGRAPRRSTRTAAIHSNEKIA